MIQPFALEVHESKPLLVMLVGIPGSGKSFLANHLHCTTYQDEHYAQLRYDEYLKGNMSIFSSDELRKELYGDESKQGDNNALFVELHRRIKNALSRSENVVYDATNINKKMRISFLKELAGFNITKVCIAVMTPYDECLVNNVNRSRIVPKDVIKRMYMNWQPPHKHEGFDEVAFVYGGSNDRVLEFCARYAMPDVAYHFDQENSNHTLSLGEHCRQVGNYLREHSDNDALWIVGVFHDVGKLDTKVRVNAKGIDDGECHYYQHHCVGAYIYTTMFCDHVDTSEHLAYYANLIYYHMHPYCSWKQSTKAMEKDRKLIGDKMFNDIMLLHEADVAAH